MRPCRRRQCRPGRSNVSAAEGEDTMDEKQILQKLDRIREIPTLPSIVFELNKQLQDPDASVARISQTIEKDQAMALKILKLVNSAFYGFQSKISDIRNAVVLLGFNAVRNAIVSLAVIEAFGKNNRLKDFDITDFWKHSLAVAVTSKSISVKSRTNSPDNCFVGGLLHDVGKVILAQYFQELFASVWSAMQKDYDHLLRGGAEGAAHPSRRDRGAPGDEMAAAPGAGRGHPLAPRLSAGVSERRLHPDHLPRQHHREQLRRGPGVPHRPHRPAPGCAQVHDERPGERGRLVCGHRRGDRIGPRVFPGHE